MPSNWMSVDSNFPSFTGEESPTQQIRALHNYLFCLKEQLQYSLQNLTADNWNGSALQSLTDDARDQLSAQLATISNQVSQLKVQVETLQGRVTDVSDLSSRITDAEEKTAALETRMDTADAQIAELTETTAALDAAFTELFEIVDGVIQTAEDGSATLGKEGSKLYLVGEVYVNGVLLEQGGTDETA